MRYSLPLLLGIFLFALPPAIAQDESPDTTATQDSIPSWKKGSSFNFNLSQIALQNWSSGGQNSISGTSVASFFANYTAEKATWKNSLDMAYGLLSRDKGPFIKSDDRFELLSRYGREFSEDLYYSARLNFRSQFAPGYEFPETDSVKISDLLSPGYVKGALGVTYQPSDNFDVTLSPAANKTTIVRDETLAAAGAYGVEPGENVRYEFGGNLSASVVKTILPNVRLKSDLSLFSNYLEKPENIDVNFSMLLNMKVNSFITASIATHMIYDDDIKVPVDSNDDGVTDKRATRLQFKEVLNIGISFNLGDEEG